MMRRLLPVTAAALLAGCAPRRSGPPPIPPVGVPGRHSFVLEERLAGPIVLVFPGRSAPTDDATLGIRRTAVRVAEKIDGSVALFSWRAYGRAREWVARQARKRRAAGRPARLALVGHSWGGQAAGSLAREVIKKDLVDEVTLLVTVDAVCMGYAASALRMLPSVLSLEMVFPHRLRLAAFRRTPAPDGKKLLRHVNYYQLDSPHLSGAAIPTASENHEVWFDRGRELGHGNLDNFIAELVAEDVRRAFLLRGRE